MCSSDLKAYEKMGHGSEPAASSHISSAGEAVESETSTSNASSASSSAVVTETYDEEFYDSYEDAADEGPGRSGRSIEEDASLIPFNELMERLARERRSLNRGPQRRELPQAKDDDF